MRDTTNTTGEIKDVTARVSAGIESGCFTGRFSGAEALSSEQHHHGRELDSHVSHCRLN